MPLLDEGVDVWRPVQAERLSGGLVRVLGPVPDGEVWAFSPGAVVGCEPRRFSDGSWGLVPVRAGLARGTT